MSETDDKISALQNRVAALEETVKAQNASLLAVGRWLKALANNDLIAVEFWALQHMGKDTEEANRLLDLLFSFRDDIEEKVVTDDRE